MRVTCSIDDGHPSDGRSAELLARHGLRATFFVPARNREGPPVLAPAAVRQLDACFEIGSHTLDHCFLPALGMAAARHQIEAGKRALEDQLGHRVAGFCYPGGRHGPRERALVAAAGFGYARSTRNLALLPGEDRWSMPTTAQFYPHARAVVLRNYLSQPGRRARAAPALRALRAPRWDARLRALAGLVDERGGVFHLWWHSRDLDLLGLWAELDSLLGLLSAMSAPHERLTNGQFWPAWSPVGGSGATIVP